MSMNIEVFGDVAELNGKIIVIGDDCLKILDDSGEEEEIIEFNGVCYVFPSHNYIIAVPEELIAEALTAYTKDCDAFDAFVEKHHLL